MSNTQGEYRSHKASCGNYVELVVIQEGEVQKAEDMARDKVNAQRPAGEQQRSEAPGTQESHQ